MPTRHFGFDPYSDAIGGLTPRFAHINRAAGTILNYYNPEDYALAAWKMDQALKPTQDRSLAYAGVAYLNLDFGNASLGGSLADLWDAINAEPYPGYGETYYERNGGAFKRVEMDYYDIDYDGISEWAEVARTPLSQSSNLYEMFAFCASSIVAAVGGVKTMAGLSGVFNTGRDLSTLAGTTAFNALNTGHSAQFVHSYLDVKAYWDEIMADIQ